MTTATKRKLDFSESDDDEPPNVRHKLEAIEELTVDNGKKMEVSLPKLQSHGGSIRKLTVEYDQNQAIV